MLGGLALLVVAAAATAIVAPRIDDSKDARAAAEARERDQRRVAERERVRAEQRSRRLDAAALRPAPGASDAERLAARAALLERAERAIGDDARTRAEAGELKRHAAAPPSAIPTRHATTASGPSRTFRPVAASTTASCSSGRYEETERNVAGKLGYPFRAVLDFDRFRVAWCKTNPIPGERVVPDPRYVVELPGLPRAVISRPGRCAANVGGR